MRILHLVSSTDRRGAQIFASDLVGALKTLGTDQRVVALRGAAGPATSFEAPSLALRANGSPGRFDGRILRGVAREIARFGPNVIQAHGGETLKYAIPATLGRRVPVVYRRIGSTPEWASSAAQRSLYGVLARRAAALVAVSESTRAETLRVFHVAAARTVTIPNAVDARRLRVRDGREGVRRRLGISDTTPLVVSVGALTWEKDPVGQVEIAAHVLKEVPGAVFVLAGDGPLASRTEADIAARGIGDRVRLLGVRTDVPDLLAASDVLLLASSTEGSPAVVIEAGLLGVPVAAYAVGGVPEQVEDGVTGVLAAPGDRAGLAAALSALLGDQNRRGEMGRRGVARCREAFEIGAVAPRYLEVYERVARDAASV
jgi:glycosyltransferase involved in cell wall biosynthesis